MTAPASAAEAAFPIGDDRLQCATRLLADIVGAMPRVVAATPLGHQWAPVTRVTVDVDVPGGGSTVIVKTRRREDDGHGGIAHLRREEAGLRIADRSGVAPRLIAADHSAGVVVMTDVGDHPSLESLLLGHDAQAATAAFVALGRAVGRLHASTSALEHSHAEVLGGLGGDARAERLGQWRGIDRWDLVEDMVGVLEFPDPRAARSDVHQVHEQLIEPGPFVALAHGDLAPHNALIVNEGALLVDYEGATFGHMGSDLSHLHYPFPCYSAHWSTIPSSIVDEADAAYRSEVRTALPPRAIDSFDEMMVTGLAASLAVRLQRLDRIAADGQAPHDSWRRRAQMVQQLRTFAAATERRRHLTAFGAWASDLADAMTTRWENATNPPPPVFPAFADLA